MFLIKTSKKTVKSKIHFRKWVIWETWSYRNQSLRKWVTSKKTNGPFEMAHSENGSPRQKSTSEKGHLENRSLRAISETGHGQFEKSSLRKLFTLEIVNFEIDHIENASLRKWVISKMGTSVNGSIVKWLIFELLCPLIISTFSEAKKVCLLWKKCLFGEKLLGDSNKFPKMAKIPLKTSNSVLHYTIFQK